MRLACPGDGQVVPFDSLDIRLRGDPVCTRGTPLPKCVLVLVVMLCNIDLSSQNSPPSIANGIGHINGTPLTNHTANAFNASGGATLVALVSINTPWDGQPVSINGVSDNLGNTWNVLTGRGVFRKDMDGALHCLLCEPTLHER